MSFCWAPQTDCSASFRWASIRWKNLFSGSVGGRWATVLGTAVVGFLARTLALVVVLTPAGVEAIGATGGGGWLEAFGLVLTTVGTSTVAGVGKGAGGRSWSAARALASAEIVDGGGATGCGGWLEGPDSFAAFVLVLVMAEVPAVAGTDGGGDESEV